jgi:hypothetical protein
MCSERSGELGRGRKGWCDRRRVGHRGRYSWRSSRHGSPGVYSPARPVIGRGREVRRDSTVATHRSAARGQHDSPHHCAQNHCAAPAVAAASSHHGSPHLHSTRPSPLACDSERTGAQAGPDQCG